MPPWAAVLLSPLLVAMTTAALFRLQEFLKAYDHLHTIRPFDIGYLLPLVVVTALAGRAAGFATLALSVLASVCVLSEPHYTWRLLHARDWVEQMFFLVVGSLVVMAVDTLRAGQKPLEDVSDTPTAREMEAQIRHLAEQVEGVQRVGRCLIRRRGLDYAVDMDVLVSGDLSVRDGRAIARHVEEALCRANPFILRVRVHIETQDSWAHPP